MIPKMTDRLFRSLVAGEELPVFRFDEARDVVVALEDALPFWKVVRDAVIAHPYTALPSVSYVVPREVLLVPFHLVGPTEDVDRRVEVAQHFERVLLDGASPAVRAYDDHVVRPLFRPSLRRGGFDRDMCAIPLPYRTLRTLHADDVGAAGCPLNHITPLIRLVAMPPLFTFHLLHHPPPVRLEQLAGEAHRVRPVGTIDPVPHAHSLLQFANCPGPRELPNLVADVGAVRSNAGVAGTPLRALCPIPRGQQITWRYGAGWFESRGIARVRVGFEGAPTRTRSIRTRVAAAPVRRALRPRTPSSR